MRRRQAALTLAGAAAAIGFCVVALLTIDLPGDAALPREALTAVRDKTGVSNLVAALLLDVRLYDTLFELFVFSMAVLGVRSFLKDSAGPAVREPLAESHVVRHAAYVLFPAVALLAAYLAVFGHVAPGGGFGGGAVAATGFLLVCVALGVEVLASRIRDGVLEWIEGLSMLGVLAFAVLPGAAWGELLSNPLGGGRPGGLASGGAIPALNLLIACKVFAGAWAVTYHFVRHRGEV